MKKSLIVLSLAFVFILSGCGKKAAMNELGKDDKYHYENRNFGFSLTLPKEFEYFQTQSQTKDEFSSLEFYVPTGDENYGQPVPGYGKPVEVRAYRPDVWERIQDKPRGTEVGKTGSKIYIMIFWDKIPYDWKNKWNAEMEKMIKDGFKVL